MDFLLNSHPTIGPFLLLFADSMLRLRGMALALSRVLLCLWLLQCLLLHRFVDAFVGVVLPYATVRIRLPVRVPDLLRAVPNLLQHLCLRLQVSQEVHPQVTRCGTYSSSFLLLVLFGCHGTQQKGPSSRSHFEGSHTRSIYLASSPLLFIDPNHVQMNILRISRQSNPRSIALG